MPRDTLDYRCFDFVLRSTVALPELPASDADDDRPVVSVRQRTFADPIDASADPAFELRVAGDAAILSVPGIARYRIRGGAEILVDPAPGASPRMVRLFLLGSALGVLALQRGLLLLHANAVVAGDGAYAFAGPSGAGKSTLAAHFQRIGYPILCDDVCGISFDAEGAPHAWPGLPRIKLWRDAAERLDHDPDTLDRVVDDLEKYHVPFAEQAADRPVPLRALYVLDRAPPGEPGSIEPLRGMAAMGALIENSYRHGYVAPLGLAAAHFAHCAALLARTKMFRASRAWGHDVLAREVARIEDHMGRIVPGATRQ